MLGGYAVGVPVPRTQNHADLERYLRMEYNGRMNVANAPRRVARVSRKARTKDRRGFAGRSERSRRRCARSRRVAGPRFQRLRCDTRPSGTQSGPFFGFAACLRRSRRKVRLDSRSCGATSGRRPLGSCLATRGVDRLLRPRPVAGLAAPTRGANEIPEPWEL